MSNSLRKKKKKHDMLWENRKEKRNGVSVHSNAVNDALIQKVFKSLQYMGYMTLDDRFGFGKKRLVRYWDAIQALFEKWQSGEYTTSELMVCVNAIGFDYNGYVKSIPFRYKLFLGGFKNNQAGVKDINYVMDAPIIAYVLMSCIVLKNEFKFSKPNLEKFNAEMLNYMDSYANGYLNDEMIKAIMLDENGIDLENGCVVERNINRDVDLK